jgi:hypothetical protein
MRWVHLLEGIQNPNSNIHEDSRLYIHGGKTAEISVE